MDSLSKRSAQDALAQDALAQDALAQDASAQSASTGDEIIKLRLYVAGNSPNSTRALHNLRAICTEYFVEGSWNLEVIDILEDPLRAVEDKILVTPTLLKLNPPVVHVIGDLSERQAVLDALNIQAK